MAMTRVTCEKRLPCFEHRKDLLAAAWQAPLVAAILERGV